MKNIEFSNHDQYGLNEVIAEKENLFYIYVDGFLVKTELMDHWNDEGAFVKLRPTGAYVPLLIDVYKTKIEWVKSEGNPNGSIKLSQKDDPEKWTLCELVVGYENDIQKNWFITSNHENPEYCTKSPKQIIAESNEVSKAGTDAINEDQSN